MIRRLVSAHWKSNTNTLVNSHITRTFSSSSNSLHGTTILSVRTSSGVVMVGDGQISFGSSVLKPNAKKVRVIGGGKVICGFAGSTADCLTLLDLLERKLDEHPGQLMRAAVELAKLWRTDRALRHLEASMIAADKDISLMLTGNGDVINDPVDGLVSIGSGSAYALAAARALTRVNTAQATWTENAQKDREMSAREIALRSMKVASDLCVYTNGHYTIEELVGGSLLSGEAKEERERKDKIFIQQLDVAKTQ